MENNLQQVLMSKVWKAPRRFETFMKIRGKILNIVQLNDIGKRVEFGKELNLNEYEVNRSRDLQNAIKRDWVEIVFDRGLLKRATSMPGQPSEVESDIVSIARKMAQTMAEEMVKNSSLVREIAKEVAKEMLTGIQQTTIIQQTPEEKKIDLKSSDNIFVDFKDEEVGIKANLKDVGKVEVQKDDLTSSLEKMKKFRQQKG